MSSTGIKPLSSGPLIIRTYLTSSSNNTFVLGNYDIPISSNRVLITSSSGLLVPSDNITISSINVSSLYASTINTNYLTVNSKDLIKLKSSFYRVADRTVVQVTKH